MTKSSEAPDAPPDAEKVEALPDIVHVAVGRVVHYWPAPHEARYALPGPWAAIVTLVGEDSVVTLNLMLPVPTPIGTDPVARLEKVPYSFEKAAGCWSWPDRMA